ncbi:AAA family ATPase [Hymenobacter rubidus]|uniref:AAA family ATPase n=1 Tax=Hymenobacter rubidus TaxID=1441626 RepID=UPI0037423ECE
MPKPNFLLATQNPIEQSGTYPLPEAQLDRFLRYVRIGYPTAAEELAVLRGTTGAAGQTAQDVLGGANVRALRALVRQASSNPELEQFRSRCNGFCEPLGARHAAGYLGSEIYPGPRALGRWSESRTGAGTLRQSIGVAARPLRRYAGGHSDTGTAHRPATACANRLRE